MTSSFQPVPYQTFARPGKFDPVQAPNLAAGVQREGEYVAQDMRARNLSEQQNYKTQLYNQQIQQAGFQKLAQFSQTLTNTLVENQKQENEKQKLEGLNRVFIEGVPADIKAEFEAQKEQVDLEGLTGARILNNEVESGNMPYLLARKLEGMSPHMQVGYATGLLRQLGKQYPLDMQTELLEAMKDQPDLTDEERYSMLQNYRSQWLQKTGLTDFNPVMLDKTLFPGMREVEAGIINQWGQAAVQKIKDQSIEDAVAIVGDIGNASSTQWEVASELLRSAGYDRATARKKLLDSIPDIEGLEEWGNKMSFDGKTRLIDKYDDDFKAREREIISGDLSDYKLENDLKIFQAQQYFDQNVERWQKEQPTMNEIETFRNLSQGKYGYVDPRLKSWEAMTQDADAEKFWTDYFKDAAARGDLRPEMLELPGIPQSVKMDPSLQRLAKAQSQILDSGGEDPAIKELKNSIKKPNLKWVKPDNYIPGTETAMAVAEATYKEKFAKYSLTMSPAEASAQARDEVLAEIRTGIGSGVETGEPGVGRFALSQTDGYVNIFGQRGAYQKRAEAARKAVKTQRTIDTTIRQSINSGSSVRDAIMTRSLIPTNIIEDTLRNHTSPNFEVPAIANYIAAKTGFRMTPWEVLAYQVKIQTNRDLQLPPSLQPEAQLDPEAKRLLYDFPTPMRRLRGFMRMTNPRRYAPQTQNQSNLQYGGGYNIGDTVGDYGYAGDVNNVEVDPNASGQGGPMSFYPELIPNGYGLMVEQAAVRNGIEPSLLAGLIAQESTWDINATSPVGAEGLGQFMPETAREFGVDVRDARSSIEGAAKYLKYLRDYFEGDMELAIYAYNGGMGNISRYNGPIPGNTENQQYLDKVMKKAAKYGYDNGWLPIGLNDAVLDQIERQ